MAAACFDCHDRYSSLCLPGGWDEHFYDQLRAGDHDAIEKALCFLEVRPYFFRSGYHFKAILQKCKHAPMQGEQAERFAVLLAKYREWKKARDLKATRGALVRRDLLPLTSRFYKLFPVRLSDGKFDGVVTVGDLYIVLCNALKLEPCSHLETEKGAVRPPRREVLPSAGIPEFMANRRAWREFPWTPEDVWATLVATIVDVYKLDPSYQINPESILREPATNR
jgi:hypothetical protein